MAREWADLSRDDQLLSIYAELRQIREALVDAQDATNGFFEWECNRCGTTVKADERQAHARERHNAPPGMVDGLFERVE